MEHAVTLTISLKSKHRALKLQTDVKIGPFAQTEYAERWRTSFSDAFTTAKHEHFEDLDLSLDASVVTTFEDADFDPHNVSAGECADGIVSAINDVVDRTLEGAYVAG